jgi:hypothetical protein
MSEHDLDALRRAWAEIPAPAPFRALEEEDADTQRSVAWLRTAWQSADAPQLPALPHRLIPRRRQLPRWIALAAAAGLLAVLGRSWYRTEVEPLAAPGATPVTPTIEVLASSRERIELRSGTVRLTWLHASPPASLSPTPEQP